ncbi:glycoside hydrolase family 2 TIM barrel-domain containing protein [soil metagenome]
MAILAMALVVPTVSIVQTAKGPQLVRGGVPYTVKGAGGDTGDEGLDLLVKAGGNSIRTWGSEGIGDILDRAEKRGLTVTVGMWLGHVRHGFKWDDPAQIAAQREMVRKTVRENRDRPAVLMWALGNEMESDGNDNPRLWKEIEALAKIVKAEDPNHPVLTVTADMNKDRARMIIENAPSLDLIGLNSYGGLVTLGQRLTDFRWKKPYIVTEFGPAGPWESPKTAWGAAIEATSTEKAKKYEAGYEAMAKDSRCLGSYAFTWGHKQEETSTWFGMLLPTGERTESVDVATKAWTGKWPANRSPQIESLTADQPSELEAGQAVIVALKATDADGNPLACVWQLVRESSDKKSGGDDEAVPQEMASTTGEALKNGASRHVFHAPKEPGAPFRVFVTVRDGKGNAAVANLPFRVKQ